MRLGELGTACRTWPSTFPELCPAGVGGTQAITGHSFGEGGLACRPVSWEHVKSQASQERDSVTSRVKGRQESELMVDLSSPAPPRPEASPTFRKYGPAGERSRVLISCWKSADDVSLPWEMGFGDGGSPRKMGFRRGNGVTSIPDLVLPRGAHTFTPVSVIK